MKYSMSWITIHCVVLLMRGDIKHEIFNKMNQHDLKHLRNTTNRLLTASVWCPGISINLCEHNDTFITLTCYSVRQKSHYEDVQHFQPRPGGRSVWGEESPQPSKAVGNEKHFCVVWIRSKTIREILSDRWRFQDCVVVQLVFYRNLCRANVTLLVLTAPLKYSL